MPRFRLLVVIAALATSAYLSAQSQPIGKPVSSTVDPPSKIVSVKTDPVGRLVNGGPVTSPFAIDESGVPFAHNVQFRPEDAMSRADQDLVANAASSIQERLHLDDLDFTQGKWNFQQIACTAFPNHLLVRYARNEGANDVSMFSVSIPRGNEGRLRIIPIFRRGYSLFSPAARGPRTIAAFNHMRSEEQYDKAPDWVATGLCYAALTGANPQIGREFASNGEQQFPVAASPTLQVLKDGGAVVRFADSVAHRRPMGWALTFDRKGKLLKAEQGAFAVTLAKVLSPPQSNPPMRSHNVQDDNPQPRYIK